MWLRVRPRLCVELYCYIKLELGLAAGIRGASGRVSGRMSAGEPPGVSWVVLGVSLGVPVCLLDVSWVLLGAPVVTWVA